MITETQVQDVVGSILHDAEGTKVGRVGQVYLDDATGRPEFVTVHTGLFGMRESFVPVGEAEFNGERLTVPFTKDRISGAPRMEADDGHLEPAEEEALHDYYGGGTGIVGDAAPTGRDLSGPETDDAMTRSEERVDVGTVRQETGRARLRKYVTTETETVTVPVEKEHLVVEREPVTDANRGAALDGPEISEEEHEVVLHEDRPVVDKHTEPVERVRVGTETEHDRATVSEEVRKEQVALEGDGVADEPGTPGTDRGI